MHYLLRIVMGAVAVAAFLNMFRVVEAVRERGRRSQVDLEFNGRLIAEDFRLLLFGEVWLLVSSLLLLVGGLTSNGTMAAVARSLSVLFFVFPTVVVYRWRRRLV